MKYTAAIVDDHQGFRVAVALHLTLVNGFAIVGEAATFAEGLDLLRRLASVDLLVLDIKLPDGCGLDLIDTCRRNHPETLIVVVSAITTTAYSDAAHHLGANAFLSKSRIASELSGFLASKGFKRPDSSSGRMEDGAGSDGT